MERLICIDAPSVSDAAYLMSALRDFRPRLLATDVRPAVEIDTGGSPDGLATALNAAANWLADRELRSTRVSLGGRTYHLDAERAVLRRRGLRMAH